MAGLLEVGKAFGIDVNVMKLGKSCFAAVKVVGGYRASNENPLAIAIRSFQLAIGREFRWLALLWLVSRGRRGRPAQQTVNPEKNRSTCEYFRPRRSKHGAPRQFCERSRYAFPKRKQRDRTAPQS